MKKRISLFLTAILLCLACAFPVCAVTEDRLADQAGLLSADEQDTLVLRWMISVNGEK